MHADNEESSSDVPLSTSQLATISDASPSIATQPLDSGAQQGSYNKQVIN